MHAHLIVQRFIEFQLQAIHALRRPLFEVAVTALMSGCKLSLTRLARATMGCGQLKAALKRIDRLIGCPRIEQESCAIAKALLGTSTRSKQPLVIAVDWSAVSPGGTFVELRAVLSWLGMGRGLTIYQKVYSEKLQGNARAERELLDRLSQWIAPGQPVIIVSDAGFRKPWFARVQAHGWSWIGRVRGVSQLRQEEGPWAKLSTCFKQATARAGRWTDCQLTRRHRWPCDVVLVKHRPKGGARYDRPGHGSTHKARAEARQAAQEPWVLAVSKDLRGFRPEEIVAMYATRMQIEECFRDSKSVTLGMGLEIARSRTALRLQALLLINRLAAFLLWHIGQLAEAEGWHRRFRATTRQARELSVITLALLLCQRPLPLSPNARRVLETRIGISL